VKRQGYISFSRAGGYTAAPTIHHADRQDKDSNSNGAAAGADGNSAVSGQPSMQRRDHPATVELLVGLRVAHYATTFAPHTRATFPRTQRLHTLFSLCLFTHMHAHHARCLTRWRTLTAVAHAITRTAFCTPPLRG